MKKCSKCSIQKEYFLFNKNKRNLSDGHSSWCKSCIKQHESHKNNKPTYVGQKKCQKCLLSQERVNFYLCKRNQDGLENRCKTCCAERSRQSEILNYGLSIKDYSNLFKSQEGRCAICSRIDTGISRTKNLSIDHCHDTNKVRGLLCNWCNQGLGHFKDSIELLESAIKYLKNK